MWLRMSVSGFSIRRPTQGPLGVVGRWGWRLREAPGCQVDRMTSLEDSARMLHALLRGSHLSAFEELPALVAHHADEAGLRRVGIYVADIQELVLREATGRGLDAGAGGREMRMAAALAGRAFRDTQSYSTPVDDRLQHWLPVLDGTERLGVLRVETDDEPDEPTRAA